MLTAVHTRALFYAATTIDKHLKQQCLFFISNAIGARPAPWCDCRRCCHWRRWSSDETAAPATGPAAVKGVIPGMPVNLSQEQVQETLVLRVRLQQASGSSLVFNAGTQSPLNRYAELLLDHLPTRCGCKYVLPCSGSETNMLFGFCSDQG